jgi:hypothetical protein
MTGKATIPASPTRGVSVTFASRVRPKGKVASLRVTLHDTSGRTVAQGNRRLYGAPAGATLWVPVDGEHISASGPLRVRVALRSDARDVVVLEASAHNQVSMGVVAPADDSLELTYADSGATIYRRTSALPRIRWASRAQVVRDSRARLERLASGAVPADTVLLDAAAPDGSGADAEITLRSDSSDKIRAEVEANGSGFLVVADALQEGWKARVDGRSVPLLDADHAFVAVRVPAGRHAVELAAAPRGWRVGIVASLTTIVIVLATVGTGLVRRRRSVAPAPRPETASYADRLGQAGRG